MAFALAGPLSSGVAAAQTTGAVFGQVLERQSRTAVAGATIRTGDGLRLAIADEGGRFVMTAVSVGTVTLRIDALGYRPLELVGVRVTPGRLVEVVAELEPAPVDVEAITVQVDRFRLVEPDVRVSHEVVGGEELRSLPVDATETVVDLAPGVSDGHFRGGRLGQETYVVDGLEVKNQLEASTEGLGLELSPTSLEELEVVTGGFGAGVGSAISGVVRFTTRRGSPLGWEASARALTDEWAPTSLFTGFSSLSLSAGGPVRLLGEGTTVFADLFAQGFRDADPHSRGLTCIDTEDAAGGLVEEIRRYASTPELTPLLCPFTRDLVPHQRGDKLIGFFRLDRPLGGGIDLTASILGNRAQNELYTPAFKYNRDYQLGQRTTGSLVSVALDGAHHSPGGAWHWTARGSAMRLDRYLGVVRPGSIADDRFAGFGVDQFEFLGEDFVRSPIADQVASPRPIPGYLPPGRAAGTPFGAAAEGLLVTEGTPNIANRSRTEFVGADLLVERLAAAGHVFRAGANAKLFRNEWYERLESHLTGSLPTFARFFPRQASGFLEARLLTVDHIALEFGVRLDAFRSGVAFRTDRLDVTAPVLEPSWQTGFSPRFGAAMPIPGTDGSTTARFGFALVKQPPDFRFFLDTQIGDSLRTDIRRQGNPSLGFERGVSYEIGAAHAVNERMSLAGTVFIKQLRNLVSGSARLSERGDSRFVSSDFGNVRGAEVSLRGDWDAARVRLSYTLQKATGTVSTALDPENPDSTDAPFEAPLAFDRRHAFDLLLAVGRARGLESAWRGSLTATVESGLPLTGIAGIVGREGSVAALPWTAQIDGRVARDLGRLPGCERCAWSVVADGRNLFDRDNILGLRRDTGGLAPDLETVTAQADGLTIPDPIPRESPSYSPLTDLDRDGFVTPDEFRQARFAAALDAADPSLFFGAPLQLRLGVEVRF
ncbi:MAG: TonB-dependent receptor [Gemmatimonadota bacterium]